MTASGIKLRLGLLLLALASSCATYAADEKELLAQLPVRIAQADGSEVVAGEIEGQRYVAVRFDLGDGSAERFEPVLLIARATRSGYAYVAHFKLGNLNDLPVRFSDNSIFLSQGTVHNGTYESRYQFRLRGGRFRLVGIEERSYTLPISLRTGGSVALSETRSANLLTQTAVYRAQVNEPVDGVAAMQSSDRFNAGLPPIGGRVRSVPLRARPDPRWDLARFDPYAFHADFLCHYFDTELVFRNACGKAAGDAGK